MEQSEYRFDSLPIDVALKISSFLEVLDLCSLSCCSRFWRELCGSDGLWKSLFKERWPPSYEAVLKDKDPNFQGLRACYIKQQEDMASVTAYVVNLVEECSLSESLEISDFMKTMGWLGLKHFGFKDIQMFFFKPKLSVLLNLVGLHYCQRFLQVPASHVMEALQSSKISDREVCFNWWKIGRLSYGFRMPDEFHSRHVSLEDLATAKDNMALGIFDPVAIREVYNVQISFANL
ncbi:hypothetical protein DITRI_Ditri15bG0116600 [Diplodiscus trichospermus]